MIGFTQPPKQASLPPKQVRETAFQTFNDTQIARVQKTDDYDAKGKIEVIYVNRTKPAPIWVFDGPKPEVGDYVLVGFINGQKNNPYMVGLFSHKAWTSNFVRVEKDLIRIQMPTDDHDITGLDPTVENDPKNHLRDDATYLTQRGYIQIDKTGIKIHLPAGMTPVLPLTIEADEVDITTKTANLKADTITVTNAAGSGTTQPIARQGDPVQVDTVTGIGTITTGSSRIQST